MNNVELKPEELTWAKGSDGVWAAEYRGGQIRQEQPLWFVAVIGDRVIANTNDLDCTMRNVDYFLRHQEEEAQNATNATYTIEVPPAFYEDHADRCDNTTGTVVKRMARHLVVEMQKHEIGDLYSDACHYSSISEYDFGLCSSARATKKRLVKQFGVEFCEEARQDFRAWDQARIAAFLAERETAQVAR